MPSPNKVDHAASLIIQRTVLNPSSLGMVEPLDFLYLPGSSKMIVE
jgi:hypothetical protein